MSEAKKILICYIPGFDIRRMNAEHVPYLSEQMKNHPWAEITAFPSAELLSTMMTGQMPHEHGIWQMMHKDVPAPGGFAGLFERLPDWLTTTVQIGNYILTKRLSIPTIPPRRLREMEMTRLKFYGRADTKDLISELRGADNLFTAVGEGQARYRFSDRFNKRQEILDETASGNYRLEFLHFHSMDIMGHWILDTEEKRKHYYRLTDEFLKTLHAKCQKNGLTLVVLSDHGQERLKGDINLRARLRTLRLPKEEYSYFLQPVMARFWFKTDSARQAIKGMLSTVPNADLFTYQEFKRFGIDFPDASYGEVYLIPRPGYTFFPHDFYHPVTRFIIGLKDWQQRRRLWNPRHLTYHGYLPHYPSERGFVVVMDPSYRVAARSIHLLDVAPSMLALAGVEVPSSMKGKVQFVR